MTDPEPAWDAGLDLLQRWAHTGRVFSSNNCRPDLRQLGFSRYSTGRLFRLAESHQIIRQVGLERSSEYSTRSRICRWIGTEHSALAALIPTADREVISIRRDASGRFSRPPSSPSADGLSLLTFLETTS